MKKPTIYTLLFATIMTPNASFAMDTPQTEKIKINLKRECEVLPVSPFTRQIILDDKIDEAISKRKMEKEKAEFNLKFNESMRIAKEKADKKEEEYSKEQEALKTYIETTKLESSEKHKENVALEKKINEKENEIKELERKIEEQTGTIQKFNGDLLSAKGHLSTLETKLSETEKQLTLAEESSTASEESKKTIRNFLTELTRQKKEKNEEILKLKGELNEALLAKNDLEVELTSEKKRGMSFSTLGNEKTLSSNSISAKETETLEKKQNVNSKISRKKNDFGQENS